MIQLQAYLYGAIAAVILGLCITAYICVNQRDAARQELVEYQAQAAAVITERLAAQEAEKARLERKTQEVVNEYKRKAGNLQARLDGALSDRDAIAQRLRDALARGSAPAVPGTPAAPGGADGAAERDALIEEIAGCLKEQERLKALQDWIKQTH